jgi:hypothetical protein
LQHSIGNALLTNIILTVIILIIAFFASSLSYSKAFRVKNSIVNYIEKNGFNQNGIDDLLSTIGYRVNPTGIQNCRTKNVTGVTITVENSTSNYRYCVVKYETTSSYYYAVTTYIYFDIPVIDTLLEIPLNGETKVFYKIN